MGPGQFRGFQSQRIDSKSRVPLPSRLLPRFLEFCDSPEKGLGTKVVVSVSIQGRVAIYPPAVYEAMLASLSEGEIDDEQMFILRKSLLATAEEQYLDRQNRIRVPLLMQAAGRLIDEETAQKVLLGEDDAPQPQEGEEEEKDAAGQAKKKGSGTPVVIVASDNYFEVMSPADWAQMFHAMRRMQNELLQSGTKLKALRGILAGELRIAPRTGDGQGNPGGAGPDS